MAELQPDASPQPTYEELRDRIVIARSVLGWAPLYRAVRKALAALDGVSLKDLAADDDRPQRPPEEGSVEYLRGWHDGYDAGYAAALERDSAA